MTTHRDIYSDRDRKPAMLAPNFDGIDDALKAERRWILWRLEWVAKKGDTAQGRWSKVPYQTSGRPAASTRPREWSSLLAVRAVFEKGGYDGIGFVLGAGWTGGDLDDGRDPETSVLTGAAERLLTDFATYADVSPSGTGAKWIGRGKWTAKEHRRPLPGGGEVEVYDAGRYFTVTGNRIGTHTVRDIQEPLDRLAKALFAAPEEPQPVPVPVQTRPVPAPRAPITRAADPDDALIEKAKSANDGGKFRRLWDGDASDWGNDLSRADYQLCFRLAFWCARDAERIDRLFRRSALIRDKWDERRGATTYGERTIEAAIASQGDTYDPRRNGRNKVPGDAPPQPTAPAESDQRTAPVSAEYPFGALTVLRGNARRTPGGKLVVAMTLRRAAETLLPFTLTGTISTWAKLAAHLVQVGCEGAPPDDYAKTFARVLTDAEAVLDKPATAPTGPTVRQIVSDLVPRMLEIRHRTATGLYSETRKRDMSRTQFLAFTPSELVDALDGAADAPPDFSGRLKAVKEALEVLWADLFRDSVTAAEVDIDTPERRAFTDAIIRIWKTTKTWEVNRDKDRSTASRVSLARHGYSPHLRLSHRIEMLDRSP